MVAYRTELHIHKGLQEELEENISDLQVSILI